MGFVAPVERRLARSDLAVGAALRLFAVGLAVVLAACGGDPGGTEPAPGGLPPDARGMLVPDSPSVLLITLDTTRADRLEPYGAVDVETPALAALAAQGVVFERAMAVAPITAPTHASLLTGLYPPRHGVHDNGRQRLADEIPTLAERLAAAGYRTAAFVSAAVLERRYGLDQGFELYDDDLSASGSRRQARMMVERPAAATVDRATVWLDGLDAGESFLLWVHLFDPHAPYEAPSPWRERYAGRPYDGEVAAMDEQIGRLLRHPRLGAERTIVVAVGDHGESLGEHGERTHGLLLYEATLRIPWILRLPGGPAGHRFAAPVSQVDLLPTVVAALALSSAPATGPEAAGGEALDGRNLLPELLGEASPEMKRSLFAETVVPFTTYGWARLRALRQGDLKYIAGPTAELYDVQIDPREERNLAGDEVEAVERFSAELEDSMARAAAGERGARSLAIDTETAQRLRALGYATGGSERPETAGRGEPRRLIAIHEELQGTAQAIEAGEATAVIERLQALLETDPGNLVALQQLVRGLVQLGRLDEAATVADRARRAAPWSPSARLDQADLAWRRGDPQGALAYAGEALEIDPESVEARLERARVLARLGRSNEAAAELDRVREAGGGGAWLEVRTAEIVDLPAGRLAEAELRLRRAVGIDPFLMEAWLLLGEALERQGRLRDAVDVYREGLGRRPRSVVLENRMALQLAALGTAAATGEARAIWQRQTEDDPQSAAAWNNLASLALEEHDWAAAEELARQAVERDPALADAWNSVGIATEELGRSEEAEAAYRRAIEMQPDYWRARSNLGSILRQSGRYLEAVAAFEEVLRQVPGHPGSHFELGVLYAGPLADPGLAREHLRAVIAAAPDRPLAAQAALFLQQLEGR